MTAVTRIFKNYLYSHGYFAARKITKIGLQDQLNSCKCRKLKDPSWINCSYRPNKSLASVIQRTSGNGRKNVIGVFSEAHNAYLLNSNTPERSFNKCDIYFWLSSFLCSTLSFPIVRGRWFKFVGRAGISGDEACRSSTFLKLVASAGTTMRAQVPGGRGRSKGPLLAGRKR